MHVRRRERRGAELHPGQCRRAAEFGGVAGEIKRAAHQSGSVPTHDVNSTLIHRSRQQPVHEIKKSLARQ